MRHLRRSLISRALQRAVDQLLEPIVKSLKEEIRKSNTPHLEITGNNPVLANGRRYFSQNDEDGILLEILQRLCITEPSVFCEFGVGDGTENNTIILLSMKWRGIWIGEEDLAFECSEKTSRLAFLQRWITRDNAAASGVEGLRKLGADVGDVRVVSVDLDGNDGSIVRTLLAAGFAPDVFIVEYNAKIPPNVEFEMPYNENYVWNGEDDFYGVSLLSWVQMFQPAQYTLVACNESGVNAFFVKTSDISEFQDVPTKIEELYRTYRSSSIFRCPNRFRTSPQTVHHLATA